MIEITLDGIPRGKGRPRFRVVKPKRGGSFVSVYTDAQTRSFEDRLRSAGQEVMGMTPPIETALVVVVVALVPIPQSWSRKKREAAARGDIRPITKPDLDNYIKCVDALNGVVWQDDSQIVSTTVSKYYSRNPALKIAVQPIGETIE